MKAEVAMLRILYLLFMVPDGSGNKLGGKLHVDAPPWSTQVDDRLELDAHRFPSCIIDSRFLHTLAGHLRVGLLFMGRSAIVTVLAAHKTVLLVWISLLRRYHVLVLRALNSAR
jgi:hypothetical protein